jgi:hypothetical protein
METSGEVGFVSKSTRHIINALMQRMKIPWEPRKGYGDIPESLIVFLGIVGKFLDASIDLDLVKDEDLETIVSAIFESQEELSVFHSESVEGALSESGQRFFETARVFFGNCFWEYPRDQRDWFVDEALGLSALIAYTLFPSMAVKHSH